MITAVIFCKDKTRRVIKLTNTRNNQWHIHEVIKLGRDLEGDNYFSAALIS
jgi:hypothetical protein